MRRLAHASRMAAGTQDHLDPARVLVAVDFSTPSLAAARWVAQHLAPDAELVLAHVVPVPSAPGFLRRQLPSPDAFVREVTEPLQGSLDGLAATMRPERVRVALRAGEPAEQLATVAAEERVDLICVGRPRHRGDTVKLGRNTVDRLLRQTTVPLLQVAGDVRGAPTRLLAGVDGGDVSERVLRLGWALAARLEASLTALHVIDEDVRAYVRAMAVAAGISAGAEAAEEALWGSSASWLATALEAAGARQSRSHVMVANGDPGQEVLAACRRTDADLVVVGRSGQDARASNAVGSTTRLVLRAATCPVLVVPAAQPVDVPPPRRSRRAVAMPVPVTSLFPASVGVSGDPMAAPTSPGPAEGPPADLPPAATEAAT